MARIVFVFVAVIAWQLADATPQQFQKRNELSNYLLVKFCSTRLAQELPVCKTIMGGLKLGKREVEDHLERARKSIWGDLFNMVCSWPGLRTLEVCEERKNATTVAPQTTRYPSTNSIRYPTTNSTRYPTTNSTRYPTTNSTQYTTRQPQTTTQNATTGAPEPQTTQQPATEATTTQAPETTPAEPETTTARQGDWKRTVIFVKKQTAFGQDVFILGGIDHMRRPQCQGRADASNECAIPIQHQTKFDATFTKYADWSQGDNYLDWYGAEESQGVHDGEASAGTPLVWSTNDQNEVGYQPLNNYGPHYWMLDVEMDCSKTDAGWFEFKAFTGGNWEPMFFQQECTGAAGGRRPFESVNHAGRCGFVNVYEFASSTCEIENI